MAVDKIALEHNARKHQRVDSEDDQIEKQPQNKKPKSGKAKNAKRPSQNVPDTDFEQNGPDTDFEQEMDALESIMIRLPALNSKRLVRHLFTRGHGLTARFQEHCDDGDVSDTERPRKTVQKRAEQVRVAESDDKYNARKHQQVDSEDDQIEKQPQNKKPKSGKAKNARGSSQMPDTNSEHEPDAIESVKSRLQALKRKRLVCHLFTHGHGLTATVQEHRDYGNESDSEPPRKTVQKRAKQVPSRQLSQDSDDEEIPTMAKMHERKVNVSHSCFDGQGLITAISGARSG
jgi:hypothetical protein